MEFINNSTDLIEFLNKFKNFIFEISSLLTEKINYYEDTIKNLT